MSQHNDQRLLIPKSILWFVISIIVMLLILSSIAYCIWEPHHRDLGYGVILRPYDLDGEEARRYKIDVYDLSGKIKTPTDNGDLDLGERTATVSWEDTIEFILIDHAGEHEGLLEMLRSNYWEKLGSFKYDKVIVINDEIRYFVNTRKGVMYTYVVHNDTPIGWGIKPLTDRQIEILENGDTSVTDNVAVTDEAVTTVSKQMSTCDTQIALATYDITKYSKGGEFLAVICNGQAFCFCDILSNKSEMDYYISQAEYCGTVENYRDDDKFPEQEWESNFLPVGVELYSYGNYMIAQFEEPYLWDGRIWVYGHVLHIK